jgi:fructuronate reductase
MVGINTRARLCATTLGEARGAVLPTYDRSGLAVVVHLGVGAFARAHVGVYADDLARLGRPVFVRGVSLRSRDAEDRLAPQDGLYTVAELEPDDEPRLRVIGSITSAATGPEAAVRALAAPATRLVTVTVTEKGYEGDKDEMRAGHPASLVGVVAAGLARRRAAGLASPVIASLDNVLDNGSVLRHGVSVAAAGLDAGLAEWIACNVPFPSSVVDRMVPAPTEQTVEEISARLGLHDAAAVTTERHRSWIMTTVDGLRPLADVGVELVDDITPYQQRKLWLLNAPHSALAYCGLLSGHTTIAQASQDAVIARFVRLLVDDVEHVVGLPARLRPKEFAVDALTRFRNSVLAHTCAKVAADGSRKIPERFGAVVRARHARGLAAQRFATVAAIWIAAASGLRVAGTVISPVEDADGSRLRRAGSGRSLPHLAHVALGEKIDAAFVEEVAAALAQVQRQGPAVLAGLT